MPSRPFFSFRTRNAAKSFSERPFAITYESTIRPENLFLEYYFSCFSQNTIQNMKNIRVFSMSSCSSCLCSFIFTGPASRCHTRGFLVGARYIKVVFLTFSFIFACSGRLGGFVSVVSVVSFRPFRFVVSGFSTCLLESHNSSRM